MANHVHSSRRRSSGFYILLLAIAAFGAVLILRGHGYHMLAYAPLLILLACPMLHFGMHGGQGGHGGQQGHGGQPAERDEAADRV